MEMIRIINQNYTKEVAKQVLRSAIVITKKIFNKVLELQNEVTNPQTFSKIKEIYQSYNPTSKL